MLRRAAASTNKPEFSPGSVVSAMLAGHTMTGSTESVTTTSNAQVSSMASLGLKYVQNTVVVPSGNLEPESRSHVASTGVTEKVTVAVIIPTSLLTFWSAGQEMI